MSTEEKRLFVGIPLDETFKEELNDFYKVQLYDPKMRWTPNENLHITLVFKGKTHAFMLPDIKQKLSAFFTGKPSYDLYFEKFTTMPYKNPRMIWTQFERSPIHSVLVTGISKILQVTEDKNPIPHITLARFKTEADHESLKLGAPIETRKVRVKKVHLYESVLQPSGAEYKVLDTYILSN